MSNEKVFPLKRVVLVLEPNPLVLDDIGVILMAAIPGAVLLLCADIPAAKRSLAEAEHLALAVLSRAGPGRPAEPLVAQVAARGGRVLILDEGTRDAEPGVAMLTVPFSETTFRAALDSLGLAEIS